MRFLLIIFPLLNSFIILGQSCCSGGVGNPLAGDQSIGVLEKFHMEVSTSFQYNHSDFYFSSENRLDTISDKLSSTYLFLKSDYGLSNKFTLSIASGYFFDKTLEKDDGDKMKSSGLGDIIIFPRYEIYNKIDAGGRIEATLGVGVKIPMGAYKDSTFLMSNELVGDIYTINPAILQLSSGSQDLMIYTSILRNFVKAKCRVFATGLYIKKGYKKDFIVLDAAMNDLMRPALYGSLHKILPTNKTKQNSNKIYEFVGPICESTDKFSTIKKFQKLNEKEFLAICDVGAYGTSLSSNYNVRPKPIEILIKGSKIQIICKRQRLSELI